MRGKDSERQMQDPCAGSIEASLSVQNLPSPLELPHNSAHTTLFYGAVAIDSD